MTIDHVTLADHGDAALARGFLSLPATPVRAITVDDFAPYAERFRDWYGSPDFGQATRRTATTANSADSVVRAPNLAPRTIPLFFSYLRREGLAPFAAAAPATIREAFNEDREAYLAAYDRWAADTDPRLPDEMTESAQNYDRGSYTRTLIRQRGRGWSGSFHGEIERAWDLNGVAASQAYGDRITPYAAGFIRDVLTLGYGTPRWGQPATTTQEPPVTAATVEQIRDYLRLTPELIEPWRKTFIRFVTEEKAAGRPTGMSDDWLTSDLSAQEAYDDSESTLARMMELPHTMPGTSGHFVTWLERNGQTAPDPTGPAVPSGDGVIPIGPEHPGWADFWARARQAAGGAGGRYETYWQTLAREFGVLQPRQRRVVHVVVPVTLETEADEADEVTLRTAVSRVRNGYGVTVAPSGHSIHSRAPIRS